MHCYIVETVMAWLTNTKYYDNFLNFTEVPPKPEREKNDFA
jgi:hypothetical protein